MRPNGVVASARGLVPGGHLCWAYRDREDFFDRAREYVGDGIDQGQWIQYVGGDNAQLLRADLNSLTGAVPLSCTGVATTDDFYAIRDRESRVVDPRAAVAAQVAGAEWALAHGYSGHRAVVDCASVTTTAAQQDAFWQYEHLIDQKMTTLPMTAMCAYPAEYSTEALHAAASLHPFIGPGLSAARVFALDEQRSALVGEIDVGNWRAVADTAERVLTLHPSHEVAFDVANLEFIDHRGLMVLQDRAELLGRTIVLYHARPIVRRLTTLLPLPHIRLTHPEDEEGRVDVCAEG